MIIPIQHPDWLQHSNPGRTLRLFRDGRLPKGIAGWMIVVSLKHPLRAVYGSDLRAAWALLLWAIGNKITYKYDSMRYRLGWLTKLERETTEKVGA